MLPNFCKHEKLGQTIPFPSAKAPAPTNHFRVRNAQREKQGREGRRRERNEQKREWKEGVPINVWTIGILIYKYDIFSVAFFERVVIQGVLSITIGFIGHSHFENEIEMRTMLFT